MTAPKESNYESEKAEIVQEKNPKPKFKKESSLFHFYFLTKDVKALEDSELPVKLEKYISSKTRNFQVEEFWLA